MSVTDIITINISNIIANNYHNLNTSASVSQLIVANYLWLLAAVYFGLYSRKFIHSLKNVYQLTVKSFILFTFLFFPYVAITKSTPSTGFLVLFYVIMLIGLLLNRLLYTISENLLKKYFKITKPVAIIGSNDMALRLAGYFKETNNHFAFEGFLHQENASYLDGQGSILPSIVSQIESAAHSGIKDIYVSLSTERFTEFELLQKEAEKHCMRVKMVPDSSLASHLKVSYMGDFAVLSHRDEPLEEIENRFKKRVFDIVFSSLVIVFILSWLYPIIGLIIKLQSPGPVLFKQLRSGKNNKAFICYKFRSMRMHDGFKQATRDDDRITRIGAFLRKTSLDELPQFFNVLLGDMSTVGPRPHVLNMTKEYSQIINQYMVRHFLKSGITGWAQVNGFRGETKDPVLMQKRVEHDIWYLENWSMWLDLKIVFKTVFQVLKGDENAY
ncbi:undecaprenyl-phosphate glucose phosphotransferase [Mucilaginibacter phyllosphaerae]|nr:undecaprenyl-phosphate glucose phosphotransferase [Mucilaginibacter phyllosphaerae]